MSAADVTAILDRVQLGDGQAAEQLLPLVYDELRALAGSFLRNERPDHTLQPTALVHEAYLRMVNAPPTPWAGRRHFFAVAAKAMRRILINHAEAHRADKRGGGGRRVGLSGVDAAATEAVVDLLELHEALQELERLDPRQAQVIELRFFGGLSVEDAAEVMGIAPRTVKLDWRMARAWLLQRLGHALSPEARGLLSDSEAVS